MPAPTLTVNVEAADAPRVAGALSAAAALAQEVDAFLHRLPPEVNPFPVARQMLAPMQAALDAFLESDLIIAAGDVEDGPTA